MSSEYDLYVRHEWERFAADPARAESVRAAAAGREVRRALDVGCGAGQELIPFARQESLCVGVDVSPEVGHAGRALWAAHDPSSRVSFLRAAGEALPFARGSFDVVVCRIALPYMDNARALAEMAEVLAPGGLLFLKIHHARFYVDECRRAVVRANVPALIHAARVLVAGSIYHLTGHQPRNRLLGSETFESAGLVRRVLGRHGLSILREMPDSAPDTPSFVIGSAGGTRRIP